MIAKFQSGLLFSDDSGLPYIVRSPLIYDSALLNRRITVPVGFLTDLSSIPRGLWNILPKSGKYDRAAVVHDALYTWGAAAPGGVADDAITRAQADGVLAEAMDALGVDAWTRRVITVGIRIGGWWAWREYRAGRQPAGVI